MQTLPFATDLPTLALRCRPFGRPAVLVLVLGGSGPLAAFWGWGRRVTEAQIGRA